MTGIPGGYKSLMIQNPAVFTQTTSLTDRQTD